MASSERPKRGCPMCRESGEHPELTWHRPLILLLGRLDEKTIRRGHEELAASLVDRPVDRIRLPGGGREAACARSAIGWGSWGREPEAVNVHDFRSEAQGRTVPYGIYDLHNNRGTVVVGPSADTPEFAVGAISVTWAGKPLRTGETLLGYLRGTTTTTGLEVSAVLDDQTDQTGRTVSDAVMQTLHLEHHPVCPTWNYTLRPRITAQHNQGAPSSIQEVVV